MFGSEILEIAIGLVFVYLVCSLVATSIREAFEGILKTRAVQLERGIRLMLDDGEKKSWTKEIYDHPLVYSLFLGQYDSDKLIPFRLPWRRASEGKRQPLCSNLPAYIPSSNFALALMHTLSETAGKGPLSMQSFAQAVAALPDTRLKKAMQVAVGEAQNDLDRARQSVETWFDGTMDRVSGWYKRETSYILFAIGLVTAIALNIDTLTIMRDLASNNAMRQQLVAHVEVAYPALKSLDPAPPGVVIGKQLAGLSNMIGWAIPAEIHHANLEKRASEYENPDKSEEGKAKWVENETGDWSEWVTFWAPRAPAILAGWIISALAISLGAPFWFDTLNKLMVIRSTVKPYEKSPPEASADRGAAATAGVRAPAAIATPDATG